YEDQRPPSASIQPGGSLPQSCLSSRDPQNSRSLGLSASTPMSGRAVQTRVLATDNDVLGETFSNDYRRVWSRRGGLLRFGSIDDGRILRRQQARERFSRHQ